MTFEGSITLVEGKVVHLPRARRTVRDTMALVAIVGILLAWAVQSERLRRQTLRLMNQDIAVSGAEANYRNAGLAREAAEAAIARHTAKHGDEDKNSTLIALKDAVQGTFERTEA